MPIASKTRSSNCLSQVTSKHYIYCDLFQTQLIKFLAKKMKRNTMKPTSKPSMDDRPAKRARVGQNDRTQKNTARAHQGRCDPGLSQGETAEDSCQCVLKKKERSEALDNASLSATGVGSSANNKSNARPTNAGNQETRDPSPGKEEYDEGMNFFGSSHFSIEDEALDSVKSVIERYNEGQTHVGLHKYLKANELFKLASQELSHDSSCASVRLASLAVQIYHGMGYCFYRLGKNKDSMKCYESALDEVEKASLEEIFKAATRNCIGVLLYLRGPSGFSESFSMFKSCLKVYEEHFGVDSVEVATLLSNIGHVHYHRGNLKEALAMYTKALSIRRRARGDISVDVAASICNAGRTRQKLGQFDEAVHCYHEFLQIMRGSGITSNRRDLVTVMKYIADCHHQRMDTLKAISKYEEALTEAQASLGPFDPDVASTLKKLGDLHYETGHQLMALKYYMWALKIEEVVLNACDPNVLVTLLNISRIYRQRGDFQTALTYFQDIHCRTVTVYGANSLEVANTLSNIGLIQYQLGRHAIAFETCQEALRIQRDRYGNDENVDVASSLNSIGLVLFNQGMQSLAKGCFYDSLRIRRKILGPDHHDVATVWYNIGTFHLETGDSEQAIRCYKETLRIERLVLGSKHQDVVLTLHHLGLVHHQRGELEEALFYLEEAYDTLRENEDSNQEAVSKLLNLIGNIHMQTANIGSMMECYVKACRMSSHGLVIGGYHYYSLRKMLPPSAKAA